MAAMARNPYDVLELSAGRCGKKDIKKSYNRLSLKHHPDKPGGNTQVFQEIKAVYDILCDPESEKCKQYRRKFLEKQASWTLSIYHPSNAEDDEDDEEDEDDEDDDPPPRPRPREDITQWEEDDKVLQKHACGRISSAKFLLPEGTPSQRHVGVQRFGVPLICIVLCIFAVYGFQQQYDVRPQNQNTEQERAFDKSCDNRQARETAKKIALLKLSKDWKCQAEEVLASENIEEDASAPHIVDEKYIYGRLVLARAARFGLACASDWPARLVSRGFECLACAVFVATMLSVIKIS